MIQPNELRIGNWVFDIVALKTHQLIRVDLRDVDAFNPIPLTPEILENCGIESDFVIGADREEFEFWKVGKIWIGRRMNVEVNDIELPHIKHLHQLQNLYFALTGTELNYKP